MKKINTLFRKSLVILSIVVLAIAINSCEDNPIVEHGLDAEQLVAGRIAGTWANPSNITTPGNVPAEVFGEMRLRFTTNGDGYPNQFIASGCPIVFSSEAGAWSLAVSDSKSKVTLNEVVPVDEFSIEVSSSNLTISFYMGWENTETGETGEGEFSATLRRL